MPTLATLALSLISCGPDANGETITATGSGEATPQYGDSCRNTAGECLSRAIDDATRFAEQAAFNKLQRSCALWNGFLYDVGPVNRVLSESADPDSPESPRQHVDVLLQGTCRDASHLWRKEIYAISFDKEDVVRWLRSNCYHDYDGWLVEPNGMFESSDPDKVLFDCREYRYNRYNIRLGCSAYCMLPYTHHSSGPTRNIINNPNEGPI